MKNFPNIFLYAFLIIMSIVSGIGFYLDIKDQTFFLLFFAATFVLTVTRKDMGNTSSSILAMIIGQGYMIYIDRTFGTNHFAISLYYVIIPLLCLATYFWGHVMINTRRKIR